MTWLVRVLYTTALVAVCFGSLAVAGVALYDLNYNGRMYPGVHVGGIDLSGQEPLAAGLRLTNGFAYPQAPSFVFRDGSRQWQATPADLGLTFDLAQTLFNAYQYGRTGHQWFDFRDQAVAWYWGSETAPVVVYDENRTRAYLEGLAALIEIPTREASLTASGTVISAAPGQVGRRLDVDAALSAVRPALLALSGLDLTLAVQETPPLVLDASLQAAAAQAIVSAPLVLTITQPISGDPGPWTIDPAALGAMLRVQRVQDTPNSARFEVGLDPEALRTFLTPLREPLAREARDARFVFNDETQQLDVIQPSQDARTLDVEATIRQINAAVAQGQHAVPLAFQLTPPAVPDTRTAADLGITQLVSQQSTYFLGSSAERINNVQVAASRFHGLLVPPNATFSFVEHLGDVSLDSGFAEALIIFGGRTIRGVGGGVCQVSTTLFRTAYFGGYPIVERWSHAYRVGYYERGDPGTWSGPGLDATVFAPLVDFKFQNDTPYWLLMEVYVNPAAGRITWKFYSTSDGREVQVSPPQVTNEVPPPDPLYEEDPALAAGDVKQVDYAAVGADVVIYRTITRGGQVVNPNETPMTTHYQPWRAIYHYGPGTEGMPPGPPPTPTP